MAKVKSKIKPKYTRLCIDIPSTAHKKLKIWSAVHEKNMGDIVAMLVDEFVKASDHKGVGIDKE